VDGTRPPASCITRRTLSLRDSGNLPGGNPPCLPWRKGWTRCKSLPLPSPSYACEVWGFRSFPPASRSHSKASTGGRKLGCLPAVGLLLVLYRACVPPTGSYGCEVWAFLLASGEAARMRSQLSTSHLHMLKLIAGVRTSACTDLLFKELGVRSLEQLWWKRTGPLLEQSGIPPPH
jgi:hypothetical protein